jgi:hypothetical protein
MPTLRLSVLRRVLLPLSLVFLLAPVGSTGCDDVEADPNACSVNADCADSPEAERVRYFRCGKPEVVCVSGRCSGGCGESCQAVAVDVNPCGGGAFCDPKRKRCFRSAIDCKVASDCPVYRPSDAPASFAWSCVDGFCAAPGIVYATE